MKPSNSYIIPGLKSLDELIAGAFNTTVEEMKNNKRKRESFDARMFAMWYRKRNSSKTFAQIGVIYGDRDHTTALTAVKKAEVLMESDKIFRQKCEKALKKIEQSKIRT